MAGLSQKAACIVNVTVPGPTGPGPPYGTLVGTSEPLWSSDLATGLPGYKDALEDPGSAT